MKKELKKAFTLAEVLIALTIIGVIAAITVPALVQRTNKQEYVTALQKAYSTLSQAANMIIAEEGSPKGDDSWVKDNETFYNTYKRYLNNVKECSSGLECFKHVSNERYKSLSGSYSRLAASIDGRYSLISADGMLIQFGKASNTCSSVDDAAESDVCGIIIVDLNGEKKPNTIGRDTFEFALMENGLTPSGCKTASANKCPNGKDGTRSWSCACTVLSEGKMDY